jgi:hypothetical protein
MAPSVRKAIMARSSEGALIWINPDPIGKKCVSALDA